MQGARTSHLEWNKLACWAFSWSVPLLSRFRFCGRWQRPSSLHWHCVVSMWVRCVW